MSKVKITLIQSRAKRTPRQKATLIALGFRRTNQSIEKEVNAPIQGMIDTVKHMLKVENI